MGATADSAVEVGTTGGISEPDAGNRPRVADDWKERYEQMVRESLAMKEDPEAKVKQEESVNSQTVEL